MMSHGRHAAARALPGASALGPLRVVSEVRHAHGKRTKPYPVEKTYETEDGNIRIKWWKIGGCRVSTLRHRKTSAGIVSFWHDERDFQNIAAAADWITR